VFIIGDVHCKYDKYNQLVSRLDAPSVQLGDMGIGFPLKDDEDPLSMPPWAYFFAGNHDNPDEAALHPQYLGKFGMRNVGDVPFFFVSGACSIDQYSRTEGVDWWRNEELSYAELQWALESYIDAKPDIMITHDCPDFIGQMMLDEEENRASVERLPPDSTLLLPSYRTKLRPWRGCTRSTNRNSGYSVIGIAVGTN
jgi:hypothetical protein